MALIEVDTDGGGILAFDGRTIEYFAGRSRSSDSRTHVRHVLGFEYVQRKGRFELKIMVGRKDHRSILFEDGRRPEVEHLEAAVSAAQR